MIETLNYTFLILSRIPSNQSVQCFGCLLVQCLQRSKCSYFRSEKMWHFEAAFLIRKEETTGLERVFHSAYCANHQVAIII